VYLFIYFPLKFDARQRIALPGCYYRDSDFCFLDDHTEGDYFDLSLVPERYTGYSGAAAHDVWRSIYDENCFGISERDLSNKEDSRAMLSVPDTIGGEGGRSGESREICLEKKVYYKIISGMSIKFSPTRTSTLYRSARFYINSYM
jgi:ERO1-like protein beta